MRKDKSGCVKPIRKHVLVAFGDITGFSSWSRRTEDDYKHFLALMKPMTKLYSLMNDSESFVKKNADECMIVMEFKKYNASSVVVSFLEKILSLSDGANKIIAGIRHPRPFGFRVRGISGISWWWIDDNGEEDFYGKTLNTAKKMMQIMKDTDIIVHEGIIEMIPESSFIKNGYVKNKLAVPKIETNGIDNEDLNLLWSFSRHQTKK